MIIYKSDEELNEDLRLCVSYLDTIATLVSVEGFREDRLNRNLTKVERDIVIKDHRALNKLTSHIKGIREVTEYFINR